ncbi:YbaB/EbfC family nucleoid-associated protein [bacterium]|nr:YbaB/EbfC family nucleoid-associated protein [bacterium]
MKMPGNLNMKNMMKQAENMKKQMEETQEKAGNEIVETTSGGGMVKVEAKAKGEITSIHIENEVLESGDKDMLEDLIQAAVNEALDKGKEKIKDKMGEVASSMGIPPGLL